MKYAWLENQTIRDICNGEPSELYHPDVAALYTEQVPDDAANGDTWDGTTLTKPVVVIPEPVAAIVIPPKVSPVQFKLLFTSPERVAIKAIRTTDAIVDDFYDIIDDARLTEVDLNLQSVQDALDYLTALGLLAAGRKAEILLGVVQ